MFELTGFQRDLLFVIAGKEEPSGQEIKDEIEDRVGPVNHGRLYPNLDELVETGLVEKGQVDRRTNYYELTDDGADTLREHRDWQNDHLDADDDPVPVGTNSTRPDLSRS
jgi:DNA-binding PadR family transcriptional regulator